MIIKKKQVMSNEAMETRTRRIQISPNRQQKEILYFLFLY